MSVFWGCPLGFGRLFTQCSRVPDFQEPYAVVVLLEKDLVLIDLAQNG